MKSGYAFCLEYEVQIRAHMEKVEREGILR
jgi:hypothetical protein